MLFKRDSPSSIRPVNLSNHRLFWRRCTKLLFAGSCIIGLAAIITLYLFLKPRRDHAEEFDLNAIGKLEIPSRIYDRNGIEIGQIKIEDRRPIELEKVPYHFIQALTAVEDSRFFQHDGIDYIGIVRAAILNFKAKRITQGASTITQQLAKQCYPGLQKKRNLDTKIIEAFLAQRLEKNFSKPEILEHYLNRIFFGSGYFGIESAARGYFGKSAGELNVIESATMCGLIKSPSRLTPRTNPKGSLKARDHVLRRMLAEGMISNSELTAYLKQPITLVDSNGQQNSYVQEMIRLQVIDQIGFKSAGGGGFKIYTTIDDAAQKAARQSLLRNLSKVESHPEFQHPTYSEYRENKTLPDPLGRNGRPPGQAKRVPDYLQGAVLMIENKTGGIVALLGGRNFGESQLNRTFQSRRPAGTAFKPFVYAAAYSENYFPGSMVKDAPIDNRSVAIGGITGILGEWGGESTVVNYLGNIPAREALVHSKNAATVRIGKKIGRQKVMNIAKKAGIDSPLDEYDKTLLGSSAISLKEFCRAFTIFPNGGNSPNTLHIISSIVDAGGSTIFSEPVTGTSEAIDAIAAYQVNSCLQDALHRGTAKDSYAKYGLRDKNAAGKTGTTYNFTDLWFIGYNSEVTCGVWAGFDYPKPIYRGAFSNSIVLPIWVDVMNASYDSFPSEPIPMPEGCQVIEICKRTGHRATDSCYEELPGVEQGARKIERCTYKEVIRKKNNFHLYCEYHSNGRERIQHPLIPGISTIAVPPSPLLAARPSEAILVLSPTVIGNTDPYSSQQPVLRARAAGQTGEIRRATPVSPVTLNREEIPIAIPGPKPIKIPIID
ncbi:MAG: transglycosylase domain-containing protein [Verrucomicrobiales bacterium]